MIAPVLRALGWDTEDLSEVRLEYRRRPSDRPVDYALFIAGSPRLFIEAKALGQDLAERKWASQIMSYAMVAGVSWVVLTDGDEYRIYNSHARVPVEDKLFKRVSISESEAVEDTLILLSKERLATMEAVWRDSDADRKVAAAIEALFVPPDPGLVRLIHRHWPDLGPAAIRKSLARLPRPAPPFLGGGRAPARSPGPPAPATGSRARMEGDEAKFSASLADLVSAGVLALPVELEATYKAKHLKASITRDRKVVFDGTTCDSLSAAAARARGSVIGRDSSGRYPPTNGWTFWRVRGADGTLRSLDELRRQAVH